MTQEIADSGELVKDTARVTAAMRTGLRSAPLSNKQTGDPICVWRDGKVIWIPADEIVIEDEPED